MKIPRFLNAIHKGGGASLRKDSSVVSLPQNDRIVLPLVRADMESAPTGYPGLKISCRLQKTLAFFGKTIYNII